MPAPASRLLSFRACAGLALLLAALAPTALSMGACSLLVEGQLSAKPEETSGAGGQSGDGGHEGSNAGSSSSSSSSSGGGGLVCPSDRADCDGMATNGCEAHVKDDPKNCGWCKNVCQPGELCSGGGCK